MLSRNMICVLKYLFISLQQEHLLGQDGTTKESEFQGLSELAESLLQA